MKKRQTNSDFGSDLKKIIPSPKRSNSVFESDIKIKLLPNPKTSNSRLNSDVKFLRLPESKRSQTTIFIILEIVIIGAIAGGTYLVSQNKKAASEQFFDSS